MNRKTIKIIKTVMQVILAGIAFWLVGWKIWLAILLMMWANNADMTFKNSSVN